MPHADQQLIWALVLVALALSVLNTSCIAIRRLSNTPFPSVRVRVRRRGSGFIAHFRSSTGLSLRVVDSAIVWLDQGDFAYAGDPLWFENSPTMVDHSVAFEERRGTDNVLLEGTAASKIYLERDQGAAAWFTWRSSQGSASGSVLVIWTFRGRVGNRRPKVVFGARADALITDVQSGRAPVAPEPFWKDLRRSWRRFATRGAAHSGEEKKIHYFESLHVAGLRGFASTEKLELAIPDGREASGLTVIVGANNSGKSSIVEAFDAVYRSTRHRSVSFAADRRHGGAEMEVNIRLERADGRSVGVTSIRAGTSEARAVWDGNVASDDRFDVELTALPSRRQFAAYFGKFGDADRGWASSSGNEFLRSQNRDAFVGRLFALHESDSRLTTFNELLQEVTGRTLTWSIDLGPQQQYFLRFSEPGGGSHTSDGLGDGLISLLFILDALHDSTPSSLIVIDEPELSLHPQYVARLGKVLARYATDRQIVFATHSPMLVDWSQMAMGARVARVFKAEGRSAIAQPSTATISAVADHTLRTVTILTCLARRQTKCSFRRMGCSSSKGKRTSFTSRSCSVRSVWLSTRMCSAGEQAGHSDHSATSTAR